MSEPVMTATELARHYDVGGGLFSRPQVLRAVQKVDFNLYPGKTLAVVGESGCGKSTLARMVTMIEEPTSGNLTLDGKKVVREGWPALQLDMPSQL